MIHNDPLSNLYTEQVRLYTNTAFDVVYAMARIVKKYSDMDPRELPSVDNLREVMLGVAQRNGRNLNGLGSNESVRRWLRKQLVDIKPNLVGNDITFDVAYGWHTMHENTKVALEAAFADVKLALTEEEKGSQEAGINTDF